MLEKELTRADLDRIDEEVKAMTLSTAKAELSNRVYAASSLIEDLEGKLKVRCNGHHAAQAIAKFAMDYLEEVWIKDEKEEGKNEEG